MKKILLISALLLTASFAASAQEIFTASLSGGQQIPANNSAGGGVCKLTLNAAQGQVTVGCTFSGLGTNAAGGHIHGSGAVGQTAPILFELTGVPAATGGAIPAQTFAVTPAQIADLRAHRWYVDIHSNGLPDGELRGQLKQSQTINDVDGDGRTDATIYRRSNAQFWTRSSLNGSASVVDLGTGTTGDVFNNLTGDFDGDGRADLVRIRLNGSLINWTIFQTGSNTVRSVDWGDTGSSGVDQMAPADYDGDGIQDIAVFRRINGYWWVIRSSDGARTATKWGKFDDYPAIGDYDGDGKADLTTVRAESGQRVWYTQFSSGGDRRIPFGSTSTDAFFLFGPFDVDGDGKQDIAINRTVNEKSVYHILRSSDGGYSVIEWGTADSMILFGDYDGDGKTDLVARRNEGLVGGGTGFVWYVRRSSDGGADIFNWGVTGDQ